MRVTDEMVEAAMAKLFSDGVPRIHWREPVRAALDAALALSHAAGQEAVDTGNLISDPLYLALDALYSRGWTDRGRHDHDPRGTNEWQAVLDIYRANAAPAQAPINPAEIDRKLVGGEAVHQVSHSDDGVDYLWQDVTAEEHEKFSRLGVPVRVVYLTPAQPPSSAEVGDLLRRTVLAFRYVYDETCTAGVLRADIERYLAASSGRKGDEMP